MTNAPHRSRRGALAGFVLAGLAVGAAACSSSVTTSSTTTAPKLSGSITVSAASSLTKVFGTLATSFEAAHPGTTVSFNFGSSGALATQITSGAPSDVFASASPGDMTTVQQAGDITGTPVIFARNSLEIVVKPGNPLGVTSLATITKADPVSLCVTTAPCGSTARQALQKAGVTPPASQVTLGQSVDATFAAVATGDAPAGIVYVTNAKTCAGACVGVPIAASDNVTTSYPIAQVKGSTNGSLAKAWIAYVLGPTGQAALRAASFLPPH